METNNKKRLICSKCGATDRAYTFADRYPWEVFLRMGRLDAEPSDDEQTREYLRKLTPAYRQEIKSEVLSLRAFDCHECGEDGCVHISSEET